LSFVDDKFDSQSFLHTCMILQNNLNSLFFGKILTTPKKGGNSSYG
jgi:hypothetical protein